MRSEPQFGTKEHIDSAPNMPIGSASGQGDRSAAPNWQLNRQLDSEGIMVNLYGRSLRRLASKHATILGFASALLAAVPVQAGTYNLVIGETKINVSGTEKTALSINGTVPGPTLRFKEGENLVINVTNTLDEDTSIHWHGLTVPFTEDGVPGISFEGIAPGKTHTYRFTLRQSGTYWYHSHSGLQEQSGVYGSIVIEPKVRDPFRYDRDYVVVLSDWHDTNPERILANLKKQSDYYNYNWRTVFTFFEDVAKKGFGATLSARMDWGEMRMTPTDIADVGGYTFLINGKNPEQNWFGYFEPGEHVRLRFINAAAMTYFDVRIPGLKMTVVQADGNNVQPVKVDEFRIAVAETYDVIVRPTGDQAYTIVAEAMARTGMARGTLAPRLEVNGFILAFDRFAVGYGNPVEFTDLKFDFNVDHGVRWVEKK